MKKIVALVLLLCLCFSLTACAFGIARPMPTTTPLPSVDPLSEPVIVLDPNDVRLENRYDKNGNHVGYYRYTGGTNCGFYGTMLLEFTDLDGNVLNAYSPKLAGYQIGGGQHGSMPHDHFEITDIGESRLQYSSATEGLITNSYQVYPCSGGQLYTYMETRNDRTTKCELYSPSGKLVASLQPLDPKNQLDSYLINVYFAEEWEGYQDHFEIDEIYFEGDWVFTPRTIYYSVTGEFLGDYRYTLEKVSDYRGVKHTRIEAADKNGEVVRVFEQSVDGSDLHIGFDCRFDCMTFTEELDDYTCVVTEFISLGTYETIFKEQSIYVDGVYSHTEVVANGGKVELTEGSIEGTYSKIEIYDAQGNLVKAVEPTQDGGFLTYEWNRQYNELDIRIFDAQGEQAGWG